MPKLEEMTNPHRRGTRGQLGRRRDEPQFEDHATSHNDPCWPVRSRGPQLVGPCLCPKAGDGSLGRSLYRRSTGSHRRAPGGRWTGATSREVAWRVLLHRLVTFPPWSEKRDLRRPRKAGQERPRNQQLIGTTRCPRCRSFLGKV